MSDVDIRQDGALLHIRLDRPHKKNALTAAMYASMADAIAAGERDDGVKVFLIEGAGGSFTAGNDLQDFLSNPPQGSDSDVFRFLDALTTATKPVVAAVCGAAIGIGTTMLLHCDLVYAADNARFALPFVSLGLCPEAASTYLLPRLAGHARAAELLLLGEPFEAATAAQIGLITRVVPAAELQDAALAAARKLAALPPRSVRATKLLMRAGSAQAVRNAIREEGETFVALLSSAEAKEAFSAFLEKRSRTL